MGHELELCKPCADLPASQGAGQQVCLVQHHSVRRMLPPAPGLAQVWHCDVPSAVLPEEPSVTSKRMRTENISHSALSMHHGALSCPAIYKTSRVEEFAVYETQMTKRLNSFNLDFLAAISSSKLRIHNCDTWITTEVKA